MKISNNVTRKLIYRFVGNFEFATPTITIRDPELIKQIGVKDFDYFSNHRSVVNQEDFIFAKSLVALKGKVVCILYVTLGITQCN